MSSRQTWNATEARETSFTCFVRVLASAGIPGLGFALLFSVASAAGTSGCTGANEENQTRSLREYELAVSVYRDERSPRRALVSLEQALRLDPQNAAAHLFMGQLYGESGLYDRAEPHLRRAVALFRTQAEEDPEKLAPYGEARNSLAAALLNLGRAAEATVLLEEVTRDVHYPSQHLALGNLGRAHLEQGRFRDAVAAFERALRVRQDFCLGAYRLGEAHLRLNENEQALAALDRALNTQTQGCNRMQGAFRVRGEVQVRLHHPELALADFTRCRDLDPQSADGRECASMLRTANPSPGPAPAADAGTP